MRKKTLTLLFLSSMCAACVRGTAGPASEGDNTAALGPTSASVPGLDASTHVAGAAHVLPPSFLGVNISNVYGGSSDWGDPVARAAIVRAGIQSVRVPGGDESNYWDWRTGWPWAAFPAANDPMIDVGTTPLYDDTLPSLQALANATATAPLYALNVMSYANALLTATTMSDAITDQLAMLSEAAKLGLPTRDFELGNELYFGNPGGEPDQAQVFPDGASYATQMNTWIERLRGSYPDAQIAVVGAASEYAQYDEPNWNEQVLSTIVGADAMTLHRYDDDVYFTGKETNAVLANLFKDWTAFDGLLETLAQKKMSAWFTEWGGLSDCTADSHYTGTWLEGLYQAGMVLQFASSPVVARTHLFNLAGDGSSLYFTSDRPTFWKSCTGRPFTFSARAGDLTATGQVLALMGRALDGATAPMVTPLRFPEVPEVAPTEGEPSFTPYPAITGIWVQSATQTQWVLANLSAEAVTLKDSGLGVGEMETMTATPFAIIDGEDVAQHETKPFSGSAFTLPPYSINRIAVTSSNLLAGTTFDRAPWWNANASAGAPHALAPDGTATAQALVEDSSSGGHGIGTNVDLVAGQRYVFSVFVKGAGRTLDLVAQTLGAAQLGSADCDPASGLLAWGDVPMESDGKGWYRCAVAFTPTTQQNTLWISLHQGASGWSYQGDAESGLDIWGAQLEAGSNPSSFAAGTGGGWWTLDATLTSGASAPDGTSRALSLVENGDDGQHAIGDSVALVPGETYLFGVYVKGTGRTLSLLDQIAGGANGSDVVCDPATGMQGATQMIGVGNGWYWCQLAFTPSDAANTLWIKLLAGSEWSYAGDGKSGLSIWGMQLERMRLPLSPSGGSQ